MQKTGQTSNILYEAATVTTVDLVRALADLDGPADEAGVWPEALWGALRAGGAAGWALPEALGGPGADRPGLLARYAAVAEGSLTAAFILTQRDAAVRRLAAAGDRGRAADWLAAVASEGVFPTVGISQLTTSRRHGAHALLAAPEGDGYRLDGAMPWVTAAPRADLFVAGAALPDGRQLLVALPKGREGLAVAPPMSLAALQASCTGEVACRAVRVEPEDVLAGPAEDVLAAPGASGTGGLETSALALGQARAALVALRGLAESRPDLAEVADALDAEWARLWADLSAAAEGLPDAPGPGATRAGANAHVLRATQAYLTARKGSGFLRDDSAQRWARQALFFLVWSCPAPVAQASLRELAGICSF